MMEFYEQFPPRSDRSGTNRADVVSALASPQRDIVDALTYLLEPKAGVSNRWTQHSLYEMATALHRANGHSPDGQRRDDVLLHRTDKRYAYINANTVTDFPNALGQAIMRTATQRFATAPGALRQIAVRRDRQNMNSGFTSRMVGPELLSLGEGGEIATGNLFSRTEPAQIKTFARRISISRQVLITDDLEIIRSAVSDLVNAAAAVEEDLLFACLSANSYAGQTMSDGNTLFHSSHGNTSTGVIASAALITGFQNMYDQTDANGVLFLDNAPRFLICGSKNPVVAKTQLQLLAFDNDIEVLVEPRLLARTDWYLAADPQRCSALEYGGLTSLPGPQIKLGPSWNVDGLEYSITHYCGATAVDWRPIWRSTGA